MDCKKLSISLPSDMASMIRRKVASGTYASNSEVIREALRLWRNAHQRRPGGLPRTARKD